MSQDAIFIGKLKNELKSKLIGAHTEKITQPGGDTFIFHLRNYSDRYKLLISAGKGNGRVHLTRRSYETPQTAPVFCMFLRKYFGTSALVDIIHPNNDRMLELVFECRDDLGYSSRRSIVMELMGRNTNLIVLNDERRIVDCFYHKSIGMAGDRPLLPGLYYDYPQAQQGKGSDKIPVFDIDNLPEKKFSGETELSDYLFGSISGVAPAVFRELASRFFSFEKPVKACVDYLKLLINTDISCPTMVVSKSDGKLIDYSYLDYTSFGETAENQKYKSYSSLIESYYVNRQNAGINDKNASELKKELNRIKSRISNKLNKQLIELKETENQETYKNYADLITANLWRIKKGDTLLSCENFYDEGCPLIDIYLDPLKKPQDNAGNYYKKYKKLKSAAQHLTVLIEKNKSDLEYLSSVEDELHRAQGEEDIKEIKKELVLGGFLSAKNKPDNTKSKKETVIPLYTAPSGSRVYVGKNNLQNDRLTFREARGEDLWLHIKDFHGSHVVLRSKNGDCTEEDILYAAKLAKEHSEARNAGKAAVDYTEIKNVRKNKNGHPGSVWYVKYNTIIV